MKNSGRTRFSARLAWLCPLCLCTLSFAAWADWSLIETYEDGTRVYVDQSSARRGTENSAHAEIKHLVRWAAPQQEKNLPPYLSTVVLNHYDCRTNQDRYFGSSSYAGNMGNGAKITTDNEPMEGWREISTGSMEEKLLKLACAAK